VWRIRLWIRIVAIILSVGALGVMVLLVQERGDDPVETPWTIAIGAVAFILGAPWLAWWPVIVLAPNGALLFRTWTRRLETTVSALTSLEMTEFGLEIGLRDGRRFITPIFQATRSLGPPRYLEFVETVVGRR
jgi:hypothetical protein